MNQLLEVGELLVASWLLAGNEPTIPTSHGLLDRALYLAKKRAAFPAWAWAELHFADGRIGLQCVELPELLDWAQRGLLTSAPNPSYETTQIRISEHAARRLLRSLKVSEEDAKKWGEILKLCLSEARRELEDFGETTVEPY
jgi:hypothetical protein